MFEGYVKVAAATPNIKVADCTHNSEKILELIKKAHEEEVRLLCLPELCITGYTCGDLFLQDTLIEAAFKSLEWLVEKSEGLNVLTVVGLPFRHEGKLYNVAAVFCNGVLLGLVPKTNMPNYGEFNELRYFTPAFEGITHAVDKKWIPFGTGLLFSCNDMPDFVLAVELCEDLWVAESPSIKHVAAGATVIANLSASSETIGKAEKRRALVSSQSSKLICGYVFANVGCGESSTDIVFSGHNIVAENGTILKESSPFKEAWAVSEIDLHAICHERRRINTFYNYSSTDKGRYSKYFAELNTVCNKLSRFISKTPFAAGNEEDILNIQRAGLAKRLQHTNNPKIVIGVSGGLDSTLALIAAARTVKTGEDIMAVTMPCFGTTKRTLQNAHKLCAALGITCREIDITKSTQQHLQEIDHTSTTDVTFENAQARMRTLVLMDLANQCGGIVLGTGDLSELALGWATYNGDHMSMYAINAGVPKTLVRHIIKYVADTASNKDLAEALNDILATPVSPELLLPKDDDIAQRTEDIVGPYELHDFFMYHIVRWGRKPSAIFKLACVAFGAKYQHEEILKWLEVFYSRFFSQQFKRSCLPDGPKIGCVGFSPRGDWKMPSDAVVDLWLEEVRSIRGLHNN